VTPVHQDIPDVDGQRPSTTAPLRAVDLTGSGADDAVTALFDSQYTRMLRVAAVLVGDVATAEDVVQEAFLHLHQAWDGVRDKADAAGYLHRSVVNGARSRLRRQSLAHRLHLARHQSPDRAADSAEAVALAGVTSGPLVAALRALPRREREVVVLRHYLDLSERQTAQALGLRLGSVKAYGSRGLAALRAALGEPTEREDGR
jgi:RNA polymerase sigma-70 factor (sigma-E family)